MMFGKKSPSAHTQSIQYSSPSTIFFTRHQNPSPVAITPRVTTQVPVWCCLIVGVCWIMNPYPYPERMLKNIQEYFHCSSHFPQSPQQLWDLSFLLNPFKHASFHPRSSTKTIHSHFQMAPICSAHSTSLGCSSIPFIVHLIDLNHLHKSSLLFWTVLNTHTTSITYFQSLSFQQHDIQPLTNIRHTQYTSPTLPSP